ncbi:hypothetical protein EPN28_00280 [Patescibacteria group bacterium]|nr:MAG: hypothetical protein EPN28_00280 [Patescibacteria group bacterium]
MFIRNPFANAFGMDISDLSIKLVQLASSSLLERKSLKLKTARSVSLPPGLIVNGEIQQPEMVRKKILYLLGKEPKDSKNKPIRASWVVANLPESKTFLKLIEIANGEDELTEVDIASQARKHLPFELEETYLDWQILESVEPGVSRVLIGASPKLITDAYTYLLESVGLCAVSLEIEAVAVTRAMITADKDYTGQARAILDLGATRSSLIVYDKNSIQFSTLLGFSGELVTTAIEQGLRLERDEAEKLKIKNGLCYDRENPRYLMSVAPTAEQLIKEIKNAFTFYKAHFRNTNSITHITMCGGMSNWAGIDSLISRKLRVSARPGRAWKNLFNLGMFEYNQGKSLELAPAIGLALRAASNIFENGARI